MVLVCVELRSVQSSDLEFQPQRYSSVSVMGKMISVEYEEEARFFAQRVILRKASIHAMLCTSVAMDDPPNVRFWTLTPDGDVYQEMLLVPSASGLVWLGTNRF